MSRISSVTPLPLNAEAPNKFGVMLRDWASPFVTTPFVAKLDQGHVHRLHAVFLTGLHDARNLVELPFADQIADGGGGDHDFQRGDSAAGFLLEQRLRDDRFQRLRQLCADLRLLGRRKGVDDAVDGFRRAGGVQGAEDQVPGLCGGQGELNRFEVAHFAHEDDIGILAERGLQRIGEGQRVNAELALVDETLLCFMNELDRIFDRDDVAFEGIVEVIDH